MWLGTLSVLLIIVGIIATVVGLGPLGFVVIGGGIVALIAYFVRAASAGRPDREPEKVAGGHKATGHAHEGQTHMVPD
jgi:hypothetical protein